MESKAVRTIVVGKFFILFDQLVQHGLEVTNEFFPDIPAIPVTVLELFPVCLWDLSF
jgi:hypothetical protein